MTVHGAIRLSRKTVKYSLVRHGRAILLPIFSAIFMGLFCGCASSSTSGIPPSPGPGANSSVPATSPSAGGGTITSPAGTNTVTVTDKNNKETVQLRSGQVLRVVLSSTYWMIHGSSDASVLNPIGSPSPSPQASGCVPGGGCGTMTAIYRAVASGRAKVVASRTSCGEAMGCTAASARFVVYVIVS